MQCGGPQMFRLRGKITVIKAPSLGGHWAFLGWLKPYLI